MSVRGFRLLNANGEGLLVGVDTLADAGLLPARGPVLTRRPHRPRRRPINNNKGFNGTENGNCKYPGDCGGGIHLNVTHAVVGDATRPSNGNADGILLTDDYGPSLAQPDRRQRRQRQPDRVRHRAAVAQLRARSRFDPTTFVVTGRNPTVGGVYDNVVRDNVAVRNGTAKAPPQFGGGGSGSGIGIFGSGPGSAAYDNLVEGNYAAGNGLAGFTIHAHLPGGEDVNGNQRRRTTSSAPTTPAATASTGRPDRPTSRRPASPSSRPRRSHMTIRHNRISDNAIGIWLSNTVTAHGLRHNQFSNVTTQVVRG